MYNFSPYMTSSLLGSQIPFSLPGTTTSIMGAATKKFSWSGIFNGIQKTVGTVNQIIPLYQNVKPIIANSKTLFKVMKTLNTNVSSNKKDTINPSQVASNNKAPIIEPKTKEVVEIISKNEPGKPFFIN